MYNCSATSNQLPGPFFRQGQVWKDFVSYTIAVIQFEVTQMKQQIKRNTFFITHSFSLRLIEILKIYTFSYEHAKS